MVINGFRSLRRVHDGILIHLELETWPQDVPLPDGTTLMETGEGPFWPYWKIYLEPDKTVEKIAGWFIVPYSLEETVEWYTIELKKRGWVETERTYTQPTWAILRYRHPGTDPGIETYVEISIRRNRYLNRTQPMIRRVTIHPWAPAEEETSEMEAEQEAIGDESMTADHGLSGGDERNSEVAPDDS